MLDFEEVKVVWMDIKSRYRLNDDCTSEMVKEIEEEEGWYNCGPNKDHTPLMFFMIHPQHPKEKEGA